ncbi:MAG: hypothetical protein WBM32_23420, partial [Crocosphaera sp.]
MNRFLRETWELFYWAMFCPSKLQQRMNEWCPAEEKEGKRPDINSWDILLFRFNFRFAAQYFLLLLCLSFPLIINIAIQGQRIDWLQIPILLLTAYGASVWFLPSVLPLPLIWLIAYLQQPDFWVIGLKEAVDMLPSLSQIIIGFIKGTVFIVIASFLTLWFLKKNRLSLSRNIFVIGGTVGVLLGSWLISKHSNFKLMMSGITGLFLFTSYKYEIKASDEVADLAKRVGFLLLFCVILGISGGFANGLTVFFSVVINLSLHTYIFVCIFGTFSFAPAQRKWLGIFILGIFLALGIENLGINSLLTIPITLIFYYRLLPDYLLSTPISIFPSLPFLKRFSLKPLQTLKLLPPHTTELLWLPLPNHDRILAAAFRS